MDHWRAALEDRGWRGDHLIEPLRASVHHKLGQFDKAKASLQASTRSVEDLLASIQTPKSENPPNRFRGPWVDQVELLILHRQALLTIQGSPKAFDLQVADAQRATRQNLGF